MKLQVLTLLVGALFASALTSAATNTRVPGRLCCAQLDLTYGIRTGSTASDGPVPQTQGESPWLARWGWWFEVVERRASTGLPYQVAAILLNSSLGSPSIVGRDLLVSTDPPAAYAGLSAFNSFPSQLREGTTNYRWRAAPGAPDTWLRRLRIHRSITAEHPTSARLETRRADGSLLTRDLWLWSDQLTMNTIQPVLQTTDATGPIGEFTISVWGSGYAAIGAIEMCQACVDPSRTPSPTPSRSAGATPTPSSPPTLGSPCDTGSPGVCAAGTWQRSTQGTLVCTLNMPPSTEVCDGLDNDCDGLVDEDFENRTVTCGVGVCRRTVPMCSADGPTQCRPGEPERVDDPCDGRDNNCDGRVDEDSHTVTCGVGACQRVVETCSVDGIEQECVPGEPSTEICDGVDNNCDGRIDEDNVCQHPDFAVSRRSPLLTGACRVGDGQGVRVCVVNTDVTAPVTVSAVVIQQGGARSVPMPLPVGTARAVPLDFSLRAPAASVLLDQTHQTALVDAASPECGDEWLCAFNNSAGATGSRVKVVPVLDTCVRRLDGYCNFTLGTFVATDGSSGALARGVFLDADTDDNRIVSVGGARLEQNQPTVFWPGRSRATVYVRTACPSATWLDGSWRVEWQLAGSSLVVTPVSVCPQKSA